MIIPMPQIRPRYTPLHDTAYCDASNISEILGVTGAFTGAALIAVILRMYVRTRMLKFVGTDDYVILAAMTLALGTFVCFVAETYYGLGRHDICISPAEMETFLKWNFFNSICIMLGVISVKISIAFFLMRLAPRNAWKKGLWGAIVFLVCFALACAGTLVFNCTPVAAAWDVALQALPSTKCFSSKTFGDIGLFNSTINILTDFLFALLPIPIILKLQVNLRTKITLVCVLSLGLFACTAGIVKAHLQAVFFEHSDSSWHDSFMVWNDLELNLGILAASLPSLKPLLSRLLESTKTALGMSDAQSKHRTPGAYPLPNSGSGYRKHYDPRDIHGILADVDMRDYDKTPCTVVETRVQSGSAVYVQQLAKVKRSYAVRITSGDHTRSADQSWGEAHEHSRSDSEERLRPPVIYRTMEISRTSEVLR